MAVDSRHPEYANFLPDWEAMRDTFRGERCVKGERTKYLPPTTGMMLDGMAPGGDGYKQYQAYLARAVFHDFVSEAVETLLGMLHVKPPTIELPAVLEPMRESSTLQGESLEVLLRRINLEQLVTGRVGILADLPKEPAAGLVLPYIAIYEAENIINWDDGTRDGLTLQKLNFVALDESEDERKEDFDWDFEVKTRILLLGDPDENEAVGTYTQGVFRDQDTVFTDENMTAPMILGNTLDKIPFVFINTKDIVAKPTDPPLLGLAKLCLAIYRGEADYRQSLFMQGQDTLVIINGSGEDSYRTGAGAVIEVSAGGDAKFIGVSSDGLSEQREALAADKQEAQQKSGRMINNRSAQAESGDALRIRFGAETASLSQIAQSGAFGLQMLLRTVAEWAGGNPDEVIVTPNMDFTDEQMQGKTLVEFMTAKSLGAPLSLETIHDRMQEQGVTDKEFDEELELIEAEEPLSGSSVQVGMEMDERQAEREAAQLAAGVGPNDDDDDERNDE
jgi:hypothetical protein